MSYLEDVDSEDNIVDSIKVVRNYKRHTTTFTLCISDEWVHTAGTSAFRKPRTLPELLKGNKILDLNRFVDASTIVIKQDVDG